jgi:hypothetical protein
MKINVLIITLAFLLILPELIRAECYASDQTYRYKSAVFYVTNARRIRVSVYNSMNDRYPRCFTAWIKVGGNYINLDGLPYSPDNWQQAWASTAPNCYGSGYRIVEGYSAYAEYDLERFVSGGYTGAVEVRVSSDCYEVQQVDPCFCWTAKVEVVSYYQPVQYCYLDIYVKDNYGNPLDASIYVDGSYLTYASHTQKQVLVGSHTVSASRSGYSSDSETVSCSCSETKRVDLVLSKTQVCTPGEIRNRYCACSTQVAYEKCKADGSGWETVIENCPSGYVCSNGYCVLEKDGWYDTGNERCNLYGLECGSGTREKEQEYRDYTCFGATCTYVIRDRKWVEIGSCYQGCASGYSCQSGYCVKVTTTTTIPPSCTPRYLDEYRCYDNWRQRKYLNSDCTTSWVFYEYCDYGCSGGECLPPTPSCTPKYLDEFRCSGNWVQRKYVYSDCFTSWIDWKYCSYGCSAGQCLPREEPCNVQLSVNTPSNVFVGDTITTTVKITNSGDVGGYVNFDAYVCKTDPYCYAMSCDGADPRVYVPAHSTYTSTCTARAKEAGSYEIKVSYSGCSQSGNVYSGVFSVEEKAKCEAKFLNEFKCDGNWKLQLYRYSDCSTAWVYVEYCAAGCCNGKCLPELTTTTTTLPAEGKAEEWEKEKVITGLIFLSDQVKAALLLLILLLVILIIIWLWKSGKFKKRDKPEWFGEDC